MTLKFSIVINPVSFLLLQCSDKLGLSLELGSFAAGVMISTTDLAQHTLEQVRSQVSIFRTRGSLPIVFGHTLTLKVPVLLIYCR